MPFTLLIRLGNTIAHMIYSGYPVTLVMKEDEIRYFRYYHYSVDGFRVLLSKMFGKVRIAVNIVPKSF